MPARKRKRKQAPIPSLDEIIHEVIGRFFEPVVIHREVRREVSIPPERMRQLLSLCHPDKHGNSETATDVTRWLLDQRKK